MVEGEGDCSVGRYSLSVSCPGAEERDDLGAGDDRRVPPDDGADDELDGLLEGEGADLGMDVSVSVKETEGGLALPLLSGSEGVPNWFFRAVRMVPRSMP